MSVIFIASPNHNARPGDRLPDMLVLHSSAGVNSDGWICNPAPHGDPRKAVSYHGIVKKDGVKKQFVDFKRRAWACGASFWLGRSDINNFSVSLAYENLDNGLDPYPELQLESMLEWSYEVVKLFHIDVATMVAGHYQISPKRKNDPYPHRMNDFRAELLRVTGHDSPEVAVIEAQANKQLQLHVKPSNGAKVRAQPNTQSATMRVVVRGTPVVVVNKQAGEEVIRGNNVWYQLGDGGWIYSTLVG